MFRTSERNKPLEAASVPSGRAARWSAANVCRHARARSLPERSRRLSAARTGSDPTRRPGLVNAVSHLERTPEDLLGPLNAVEKKNAPAKLYLAGDLSVFRAGPRVSIVGSRNVSDLGKARAQRLARALVKRGVTVMSGLAEGVDAVAHQSAIDAGGKTIAVLGTPLDRYFPTSNRALQERIMREHLAISQFEHEGGAKNFPMRNRTMALLSDATVIVEAGEKSGTVHQGWEALRLGRPLYLLQSLAEQKHPWTEDLQQYGAQVLSNDNFDEFLASIPERARGEHVAF
ncbi:MAG: DNA-protecting protein DprA [Planctomycetes bacterium]|nr:DNA-protecting protein DprA [Planctomycetota bacterium]